MDRFRREPTKFHYKKRWPSNGWTKKRNQITCNKEERISPPSYNKRPDAFWTIPLKTKGLCKFDKLETKSKRIFRKSDYIGLIYLARCLRFFCTLAKCKQAGLGIRDGIVFGNGYFPTRDRLSIPGYGY